MKQSNISLESFWKLCYPLLVTIAAQVIIVVSIAQAVAGDDGVRAADVSATGRETRATFPTSQAPPSAAFRLYRLIFGRAIIPRSALDAWMLFLERARAEHSKLKRR